MSRRFGRLVRLGRLLPSILRATPRETAERRVLVPLVARLRGALRFLMVRQTRVVDILAGRRMGNRFFWRSLTIPKGWDHVERRLFMLGARQPEAIRDFVRMALEHSDDFVVLTNLARSALSREAMAEALARIDPDEPGIARRIGASHAFAAAIVGAATLLLRTGDSERLAARVKTRLTGLTEGYLALVDSLGARLAVPPASAMQRSLPASGLRTAARHRLIIAGGLQDRQSISLLFGGAERITLYALNDLYGKADFAGLDLHGPAEAIDVEHARSRITRFSAEYHALHEETRAVAERIVGRLAEAQAPAGLIPPEARPFAELALADHLFFPALMLAAVRRLLEDAEFDHIVIALSGRRVDGDVLALLAGLGELTRDPRVELVSVSRALGDRGAFSSRMAELLRRDSDERAPRYWGLPAEVAAEDFDLACAEEMPPLPAWAGDGRARALLVSAPSRAYNGPSASYRAALDRRYDTQTAVVGRSTLPLLMAAAGGEAPAGGLFAFPVEMNRLTERRFIAFRLWLGAFLREASAEFEGTLTGHLLRVRQDAAVRQGLLSFLVFHRRAALWFRRMKAEGAAPDIVVLTPYRDAFVAAVTAIARAEGVPSLAVEPHTVNANYCRYSTVFADFYGVISSFFAAEAEAGFAIPRARCRIVGSPRLVPPRDDDLARRTAAERAAATREQGLDFSAVSVTLAFFSQPSTWAQMAAIWRMILAASDGLDVQILLKTHPEETPTRIARYLEAARESGADMRVRLWQGTATSLIESADLVLAGYSTTVIETAVHGKPAICVANGIEDYPLDQHRVIGAPLVRNADALAEALRAFVADPAPMRARAAAFLERERHLVEGIDVWLARTIDEILAMPTERALRRAEDLPDSAFLKGPHRVFAV